MRKYVMLIMFVCTVLFAAEPNPFIGDWEGEVMINNYPLGFSVYFTEDSIIAGTMDIPIQQAFGLPLNYVETDSVFIYFELKSPAGLATYNGKLVGGLIEGGFSQGNYTGHFTLAPKLPEPELPYYTEEVVIRNGDVKLAGTFSRPKNHGKHPTVVFVTGSGQQNRDEEVFGFKVFKVIADYFTRKGFAVLRCDDRGAGESTGDAATATTFDFAKDIEAQYNYLKKRPDVDTEQIGILGHSEGAIIAPLVATWDTTVSFIVLLSPPGIKGSEIVYQQIEVLLEASDLDKKTKKDYLDTQRLSEIAIETEEISPELEQKIKNQISTQISSLPEEHLKTLGDLDELLEKQYLIKTQTILLPWTKWYFGYDPMPALSEVQCPVLAIFGGKDTQVLLEANHDAIENALKAGKSDYKIKIYPDANHLFQKAETGQADEYGRLPKEFIDEFLNETILWMESKVDFPK